MKTPLENQGYTEDGFGNRWPPCPTHECALTVVRPGKARCSLCETEQFVEDVKREKEELQSKIATLENEVKALRSIEAEIQKPGGIREAAFWCVHPPSLTDLQSCERWEIDAMIAQRNAEVDRVETIIRQCVREKLVALANAHAAQPGAPREDGVWDVLDNRGIVTAGASKHVIEGDVYWGHADSIVPEYAVVAHRKHVPLEVPHG